MVFGTDQRSAFVTHNRTLLQMNVPKIIKVFFKIEDLNEHF